MNLVTDPWIPVVALDGTPQVISLLDVFVSGKELSDLAVRPHERVSLMRLFLCVAHAALDGPKDYDAWCAVPSLLPEAAQTYLHTWKDSFELFHPTKPWLQVAGLSGDKKTSVSKLNFALATGENTTLFDHEALSENRQIDLGATVVSMLSFQCFSPGGLISQVFWNGTKTGKSSKDAPCVTASMLHSFLRGKNLFETIYLNLLSFEDIRMGNSDYPLGRPVWECVPHSFDDQPAIENATKTYMGRLVPMTRLILLSADKQNMYMGDGLVYPTFTDGFQAESTATVYVKQEKSKETRSLLSYQSGKAVWRQLMALLVKPKSGKPGGALSLLNVSEGKGGDVVVCALGRDQAKILDTVESVFSIPSQLFSDGPGLATYESLVKESDTIHNRLVGAVEVYRKALDSDWESRKKKSKGKSFFQLTQTASNYYWTTVEKNLDQLWAVVAALGTDLFEEREQAWQKMLFATACDVYRVVCFGKTVKHQKSYVKGWAALMGKQSEEVVIE